MSGPARDFQQTSPSKETPADLSESVADDASMERIGPGVPQAVVALAQLGQLVKIRKALEGQQFEGDELIRIRRILERQVFQGEVAEITLQCTGTQQWSDITKEQPFLRICASVVFFNDGPNTAYILINNTRGQNSNLPITMNKGESHPIDFSLAEHRIEELRYWCDPGNTASVRLEVKY